MSTDTAPVDVSANTGEVLLVSFLPTQPTAIPETIRRRFAEPIHA